MVKGYYRIRSVDAGRKSIPIGQAMEGAELHILDGNMQRCAEGKSGEICIATRYMTLGYYGNEALTRERFVRDASSGKLLYKTGDLGRRREDGNLEFLGRMDRQVKIRGNRIELGEIEDALLSYPGISACAADFRSDAGDERYLVAYYVSEHEILPQEAVRHLALSLPNYMIPAALVPVSTIHMTPNGKVDLKALPDPETQPEKFYTAPRNEIELQLADIWSEILHTKNIGIDDNFLGIGGHSLNVMTMISKVYERFEVELPLEVVFDNAVIKDIAGFIQDNIKTTAFSGIHSAQVKPYYPLSPAQTRIFNSEQFDDKQTSFNLTSIFKIRGRLDESRLKEAFRQLMKRHESLRTSFTVVQGEPVQRIEDEAEFALQICECREDSIESFAVQFIKHFDFERAPLFRAALVKGDGARNYLVLDFHHLIADGKSVRILLRDLLYLYERKQPLPQLRARYVDYVEWFNDPAIRDMKGKAQYWESVFRDYTPARGLADNLQSRGERSYTGGMITCKMAGETVNRLNRIAGETRTTLFMLLFAAFGVLYAKYTAREDIVIGSPVEGRNHPQLDGVVGMFVNIVALRSYPDADKTFTEYLREIRTAILAAYENDDYQIDRLLEQTVYGRSRYPLFDTLFSMQYFNDFPTVASELELEYMEEPQIKEAESLRVMVFFLPGELSVSFRFSREIYQDEFINRMAEDYFKIIGTVSGDPEIRLRDISIVDHDDMNASPSTDSLSFQVHFDF
jgi:acyl carrier protein